jgi:hypothetical protein
MKSIKFPIMAIAMLLGSYTFVKAQTADEVIQKHVDAIGGLDNWKKVNSIKMMGSMNMQGTELPVTITTLNGKGYRMEFTMAGMTNYMILTPKEGWMNFPSFGQQKAEPVPDATLKEEQDQLDVTMDPLLDYKGKQNTVAYLGKDQVEGTECYKIKVTHKSGKEETIYIDATSYYAIKTTEKTKANGKEDESVSTMGNYMKLPEGIFFPMSIESDGAPITIKTVEVNKPVDEGIFKHTETK